jgi:phosphate butyryltransferase
MLKRFEEIKELVKAERPKTVAVACAHDAHTLEAVLKAHEEGILNFILIGRREDILRILKEEAGIAAAEAALSEGRIIDAAADEDCARIAVELIKEGRADFIQKGLMQTSTILRAVVNKDTGIGLGRPMSHTAIIDIPAYGRLLGVADGGMIPAPDLEQKKAIVRNAVEIFEKLGYENVNVAAVCAAETVSPKIQETVDAAALKEAGLAGELGSCYVEGPISFDLAVSAESAAIKGFESPVCGATDCFLVPTMAAGNMMVKMALAFANARMLGVVTGARCPIALNSRSASFEEKYYSLLVCAKIS